MALKIAPGLTLPDDVAGEAIAILAKRGAGKTNTATVLVEEIHRAGVQVVILDPVGAWWGIRSSADGSGKGLPIVRVGGEHGDVPLEQTAGALIADVAVDTGQSLLIDLSDFPSKAAMARFVVDFAERLFRRKNREKSLLHLVLEEADTFAPQKVRSDDARMAGAIEQIVRRGRSRGLGLTMVTQRSAVLNKDVLSQADVLIAMRTTSPHDVAAVKLWVAAHGDDEHGVIESLPGLETGEAWVWNPERGLLDRVKIRRRQTFDSSSTPKAGERRAEPKAAAEIDVAKLGAEIAATAERAKATDPKELQKRVRELERELAQRPTETQRVEVQVPVEIPVLDEDSVELLQSLVGELRDVAQVIGPLRAVADQIETALRGATARPAPARTPAAPAPVQRREMPPPRREVAEGDVQIKAGARRIVATLARHHPMRVTRSQLGTLTGFKITGGTFQTYFSQLKRLGLIVEDGREITVTEAGLDFAGVVAADPMTTDEVLAMWRGALKAGARAMLDVLVERYPHPLSKDELADIVEMTVTGGTFQTYLSTLRRNGLAEIEGSEVRASDSLFMAAT